MEFLRKDNRKRIKPSQNTIRTSGDSTSSSYKRNKEWYEFLFLNGEPPSNNPDHYFRIIQFQFSGDEIDQHEIETALKGFFTEDVLIIWKNGT